MRTFIRRLIDILDGTPTIKRAVNKGQSVVELALITPLIIILIVGIVEIGWFANNYLILLEVTRVGARRGAVLTGDNSPLVWNDEASIHWELEDPDDPGNANAGLREQVRRCGSIGQPGTYVGFYNLVLCQMVNSLDPLRMRTDLPADAPEEERTDDIIISVFAVEMVENGPAGDFDFTAADYRNNRPSRPEDYDDELEYEYATQGWIPVVVGRFPTNANECTVWEDTTTDPPTYFFDNSTSSSPLERDPFDYIHDDALTTVPLDWTGVPGVSYVGGDPFVDADGRELPTDYPIELYTGDPPTWTPMGLDTRAEMQRGFVLTGYHRVQADDVTVNNGAGSFTARLYCFGSEWTIYDVQELLLGEGFVMSPDEIAAMRAIDPDFGRDGAGNDIDTRQFFADLGLVLVEIYWRHELLLDIPVFSPVFNALGDDQTTIYVWSAFPAPAASPDIQFDLTTANFFDPS